MAPAEGANATAAIVPEAAEVPAAPANDAAAASDGYPAEANQASSEKTCLMPPPDVFDCTPVIDEAVAIKNEGNEQVKKQRYAEAAETYKKALAVIHRSQGKQVLAQHQSLLEALKAVLHCNIGQCMLSQQLYRRAIESCTESLKIDDTYCKALWRRSVAHEHIKEYQKALDDALKLKKLGGGDIDQLELKKRCESLLQRHMNAKGQDDLVRMKQCFQSVSNKYGLNDGEAAPKTVGWIVEGESLAATSERVAQHWKMDIGEADQFVAWLAKGLELKLIPHPHGKDAVWTPPPAPKEPVVAGDVLEESLKEWC